MRDDNIKSETQKKSKLKRDRDRDRDILKRGVREFRIRAARDPDLTASITFPFSFQSNSQYDQTSGLQGFTRVGGKGGSKKE